MHKSHRAVLFSGLLFLLLCCCLPLEAQRNLESEFKKVSQKAKRDIQVALPLLEKAERLKPPLPRKAKKKSPQKQVKSKVPRQVDSDELVEKALADAEKAQAARDAAWAKVRAEQAKTGKQIYLRLSKHQRKILSINEALGKAGQQPKIDSSLNMAMARSLILMRQSEDAVSLVKPWQNRPAAYRDQEYELYFQTANVLLGHAEQIIQARREQKTTRQRNKKKGSTLTEAEKQQQAKDEAKARKDAASYARKALKIFDWLAQNNDETGAAGIDMVRAADGAGRSFILINEYEQAIYGLEFALKFNATHLGDYQKDDPLVWLIPEIKARLAHAKRKLEEQKYGPDFVLYREAQKLRFAKKWLPARIKYIKIIRDYPAEDGGAYAEAATLYDSLCMIEMGDWKGAEKKLTIFYEQSRYGYYRGEALLELGRLSLEYHGSQSKAQRWFKLLEKWLKAIPEEDAKIKSLFVTKAAMKKVMPPKQKYKDSNRWGTVEANKLSPEMLVNRLTAPWYMNHIKEQAFKFLGFIEMVQGNKTASLAYFNKMAGLSHYVRNNGTHNDLYRLRYGANNLHLIARPEDLKLYKGTHEVMVKLCDFYYVTREWGRSLALMDRIESGRFGALTNAQMDYIHLLRGMVHYRNTDKAFGNFRMNALTSLREVTKSREGTHAELRATLYMAQIIREMSSEHEDVRENLRNERERLLRLLMKSSDDDYRNKATIELAKDYADLGERDKAIELLTMVHESGEKYSEFAGFLLETLGVKK